MEKRGWDYVYNTKNYNPANYTRQNMYNHAIREYQVTSFLESFLLARSTCLTAAGRDEDETMFSIQKDEAYLPEFRECVKEKLVEA